MKNSLNAPYPLSWVNGKPDLTPDQAWALADHLRLAKDEADYFFLLVLHERAVSPKLKKSLDLKLKDLKSEQLQTTKTVQKSTDSQLQAAQRDYYYSTWLPSAVHTLTACPEYQTVEKLSQRLQVSSIEIENILNWLSENGLIKRNGNRFIHSGASIHLPMLAIHNHINHLQWRLRGVQNSLAKDSVHYTSSFSISKNDWDTLRSDLLQYIDSQRRAIQSSGSDEGYAFCCDLFKI